MQERCREALHRETQRIEQDYTPIGSAIQDGATLKPQLVTGNQGFHATSTI